MELSNGPTEATNALIKKVKRVRRGFRNFDNYRPPAAARRRSGLADSALAGSACHPDQRPLTRLGGVELLVEHCSHLVRLDVESRSIVSGAANSAGPAAHSRASVSRLRS